MKNFIVFICALCFASASFAKSPEPNISSLDEELEMIALYTLAQDPSALGPRNAIDDAWNVLENITAFIEGFKDSFLATYDTNGNGIIDLGQELEALQSTVKDIVILVADNNSDGKVEAKEFTAVVRQFLKSLNEQVEDMVCTQVIVQAENSGIFLKLRPVLKHLYKRCTELPE